MKTRKLKDLKENECIKVNTRKEWKKTVYYFFNMYPNKYPVYIGCNTEGEYWETEKPIDAKILPASDFTKPKNNKLKKRVKYIEKELVNYDNRIHDIELKVNDKQDVSKTEITELPEKWCVKGGGKPVADFFNKIKGTLSEGYYEGCDDLYHHYPPTDNNKVVTAAYCKEGYNLISQSDFERLVLNKEQIGNTEQLDIDWSVSGQLLSDKNMRIVMLIDDVNEYWFKGVVVSKGEKTGRNSGFSKEIFRLFNGSICLKND